MIRDLAAVRRIEVVEITDLSRRAEFDPSLLAADDLHYSVEMYRLWVSRMLPAVWTALSGPGGR